MKNNFFELTPEQIAENWNTFKNNICKYISSPRKEKLLELYDEMEDFIVFAPAAINRSNHNSIYGGYVDHVNRVLDAAFALNKTWEEFGGVKNFTDEELAFACINHDLGKLGLPGIPGCFPNDNQWEIDKLGKLYKYNIDLPFSTVPDRSIFLLQSRGIILTQNEYLAIKIHDGMYEDANKAYLVSYQVESRLRSYLGILIHQADMLASRVEWEREWLSKSNKSEKTNHSSINISAEIPLKQSKKVNSSVTAALKGI